MHHLSVPAVMPRLGRNLDVMNEILMENEPGKEEADDLQLMTELHTTLRAMQERATALIGRVTDEIVLGTIAISVDSSSNNTFPVKLMAPSVCFRELAADQ